MIAEHSEDTLWDTQRAIARAGAPYLIGYVALLTAMYAGVDILAPDQDALFFVTAIAGWVAGYVLLALLLIASAREGEVMPGGFGTYFALGLVTGIPIVIGLFLLVIPGLYLYMRWLPAYARAYATGTGLGEAMSWSWENTKPIQKGLALAMIAPLGCYLAVILITVWSESADLARGDLALSASLVAINLFTSLAVAWMQLLGVAAYRLVVREPAQLIETFS